MDLLDRLLGHDAWTTHRVLERCWEVAPGELHRTFDVGHGTAHATIVHMIGNVRVWTRLMNGETIEPEPDSWEGLSVDDLIRRHDESQTAFAALARGIRDGGRWDEVWVDTLDDPPAQKTYGGAIAHVLTHDMHHRGELLHILGRLGVPRLLEGDALSWEVAAGAVG